MPRVLIASTTRTLRDRYHAAPGTVSWEARTELTIVCENVRRMKGLEFDFIVLDHGVVPGRRELGPTGSERLRAGDRIAPSSRLCRIDETS